MIIWGSQGKMVELGQEEMRHCQSCNADRRFRMVLRYRYWHLYYLFGVVTKKQYMILCEVCQRGWVLESEKAEQLLHRKPIPFMRRYGLLTFVGAITALVLLAVAYGK